MKFVMKIINEMELVVEIVNEKKNFDGRVWVGNAVKSSVKVLAEMKCAIQEAAEMTCAMEVKTQVKSTLNENHQWPMKAATKIKIHGGCSNCNEIYNVSIVWNEWKTATKNEI